MILFEKKFLNYLKIKKYNFNKRKSNLKLSEVYEKNKKLKKKK